MADDPRLRSPSFNDPYRRTGEPSRAREQTSDPLAELARLIGKNDPYAEFGRSSSRSGQPQENYDPSPSGNEDWQYPHSQQQYPGDQQYGSQRSDQQYGSQGSDGRVPYHQDAPLAHAPQAMQRPSDHRDPYYHQAEFADRSQPQFADRSHGQPQGNESRHEQHDEQEAAQNFGDDAPLDAHEDQMYDDAPRARHHGLATALALIGCAMLGTAGAYGYRSYYTHPAPTQPPPVIAANNATPTKVVPAGDPQSSKAIQDRVANAGKEQLVSKQEEPVALKDLGTPAAPRVVLPAPVAPVQTAPSQAPAGAAGATPEPKKVRTVTIRPDGTEANGRPVGAPGNTQAAQPPRGSAAVPRSSGGPLSLDPQAKEPEPGPGARTRSATAPPASAPRPEPTTTASSGFAVQLSSHKSESDAQASFRSLQAKFPNELGGRQLVIRRADLGSKGVFYRATVGPFGSAQDANQFCANLKSAGGHCIVPNN